ncbi:uncharacterized protein LOC124261282 [Haliotis rubra]|uniref:uncharacterized protein LOC124261282 n=1 Tax=Haliotis rubra TaxID=36100 RepID=UPI001EE5D60B|nr:uncharacterized protein LOC124261282 [Haliotis rubra]
MILPSPCRPQFASSETVYFKMCRTVVLLWLVFATCKSRVDSDWTQTGPCTCQSDDGVIDLTPLALNNGTPAFNHHTDLLGQDVFSWNPCVPFTQAACQDAAVCKYSGNKAGVVVGTQQSARFVSDVVEGLSLQYSHGEVAVSIKLKCVHETKPDVLWITGQVSGSGPYVMTLFSKHACLKPTSVDELLSEPTPAVHNFTIPTPGVVTMTSKPSNLQTITLLVSVEVLATVLILVVAVIGLVILINRKLRLSRTSPPAYGQLVIDDDDDDALMLKL